MLDPVQNDLRLSRIEANTFENAKLLAALQARIDAYALNDQLMHDKLEANLDLLLTRVDDLDKWKTQVVARATAIAATFSCVIGGVVWMIEKLL